MRNVCSRPSSSNHFHRSVPILTPSVFAPPKPFITRPDDRSSPTKSVALWEMHPEHRLSTPMGPASVSKCCTLACFPFLACIATNATIANMARPFFFGKFRIGASRLADLMALLILRLVLIPFAYSYTVSAHPPIISLILAVIALHFFHRNLFGV